jgi:hypothetical protein
MTPHRCRTSDELLRKDEKNVRSAALSARLGDGEGGARCTPPATHRLEVVEHSVAVRGGSERCCQAPELTEGVRAFDVATLLPEWRHAANATGERGKSHVRCKWRTESNLRSVSRKPERRVMA